MKKRLLTVAAIIFASVLSLSAQNLSKLTQNYGFKMGAAISYSDLQNPKYLQLIKDDFESITATNEFKAYSLLSQGQTRKSANKMPVMNYTRADAIMDFAKQNNLKVRGHVLVWDAYMPDWFFRDTYLKSGNLVDSETMKKRLEYYINDVITHFETKYPGIIYCWDVVNEAVADGTNECNPSDNRRVRTSRGGTTNYFYKVIGDDYVEFAFKCAKEAVKKNNADIKLYYNDYNTFYSDKTNAIINLVKSINKTEKLCDGVGMQGYIGGYGKQEGCMRNSDISLVKNAISKFSQNLGVEVQLTELALRNYKNDKTNQELHAQFYADFFKMLKTINSGSNSPLKAVSIWGLVNDPNADPSSYGYKMNGPYCGLYESDLTKKSDFNKVVEVLKN